MIMTKNKIASETYFHNRLGYDMVCSPAFTTDNCGAQGGVGLFVRERPQVCIVELESFHGSNLVICNVVLGCKQTPLIGAYLFPSTLDHLTNLEKYLTRFRCQDPIVLRSINNDIGQSQNPFSQKVSDLLMESRLVDLLWKFLQCMRLRHLQA